MTYVSITVDVDVDIDQISTDDLIYALFERMARSRLTQSDINRINEALGQSPTHHYFDVITLEDKAKYDLLLQAFEKYHSTELEQMLKL